MLGKFKDELTGEKKLIILYSILFVFNILLFINLFAYITVFRQLNFNAFHEVGTIIAAIIILGFISTRLPKLKESTDGSLYEIAYLIIIGILSITVSYFNKSTNGESLWAPFLEMFRMLAVMLIFLFIATKSKSFRSLIEKKTSRRSQICLIIIFSILGILASYFTLDVFGAPANARGLIVMIAALAGGPVVGIPVGIVGSEVLRVVVHILEPVPAYAAFAFQQLQAEILVEPAPVFLRMHVPARAGGVRKAGVLALGIEFRDDERLPGPFPEVGDLLHVGSPALVVVHGYDVHIAPRHLEHGLVVQFLLPLVEAASQIHVVGVPLAQGCRNLGEVGLEVEGRERVTVLLGDVLRAGVPAPAGVEPLADCEIARLVVGQEREVPVQRIVHPRNLVVGEVSHQPGVVLIFGHPGQLALHEPVEFRSKTIARSKR